MCEPALDYHCAAPSLGRMDLDAGAGAQASSPKSYIISSKQIHKYAG
jgi:hypothetical protein